jgi:hypothetical protein
LSFARVVEREGDELSESLESFGVPGNLFLCPPLLLAVVVVIAAGAAMAFHVSTKCGHRHTECVGVLRF